MPRGGRWPSDAYDAVLAHGCHRLRACCAGPGAYAWLEHAPTVCLFRNLVGLRCPGCGMTHALSALLHGEFARAFLYNKLVVVAFPALVGVVLYDVTAWARSGRRIPKL